MLQHVEEIPQGDPEQALAGDDPELQQEFRVNHVHIYRGHSLESNPAIYSFPTEDLKWVWMRSMTEYILSFNRKLKPLSSTWPWVLCSNTLPQEHTGTIFPTEENNK